MKTLYFDCFAGISGDMTLGALIDVGADPEKLRQSLSALEVDHYRIEIGRTVKQHVAATDVKVVVEQHPHRHRRLRHILQIIESSNLSVPVKETSGRIFRRLAEAESSVHGASPEDVHFHEVGAVDAIIDIVGTAICLDLLGNPKVASSPLPTFHGFAEGSHGVFPLPAPATVELSKGIPWRASDVEGELVTPTGAAIISAIASGFGPMPSMIVESVGCGAGKRDYNFPNVLRVMLGRESEALPGVERVTLVETNIDDLNPQFYDSVMDDLFAAGALDVYLAPIQMKKSRPGILLSALCPPDKSQAISRIILSETSTLGVRIQEIDRVCLDRRWEEVETKFGRIRIKIGELEGKVMHAAPEYEDCRSAAQQSGTSVKQVYDAAAAAYYSRPSKQA
ncbi:MAG: nickel pincer cofactor biosynthesis protein LarC [Armatimonadetes bacterium]|nr:nickel pincer cofactor biosynthesis protein LarC [Armatimonadota bacterium]